jgi:homoserine kinase type II
MGAALAQLHLAIENDPLPQEKIQKSGYSPAWWEFSKNELKPALPEKEQQLLEQVFDQFFEAKQRYSDLPKGLIHGDLFRDNTLFVGDELSAILDFTTVTHDDWLMDIAITMNDFCTNYPDVDLNKEHVDAFITAYESVRRLTKDERLALPLYLHLNLSVKPPLALARNVSSLRLMPRKSQKANGKSSPMADVSQQALMQLNGQSKWLGSVQVNYS